MAQNGSKPALCAVRPLAFGSLGLKLINSRSEAFLGSGFTNRRALM